MNNILHNSCLFSVDTYRGGRTVQDGGMVEDNQIRPGARKTT